DTSEFGFAQHGVLEGLDRIEHRLEFLGRVVVQLVFFRLEADAFRRVRPAGEALREESFDSGVDGGGSEIAGAFGAELVGECKVAVDVADVDACRDGGELVDHSLRFYLGEGFLNSGGVEGVEEDGGGAEGLYTVGVGGVTEGSEDLVLVSDE